MKKIIISILVIFLLVSASMVSVNAGVGHGEKQEDHVLIAIPVADIYVDDDALPGGNGSYEHPFQTVYEGIKNAEPGDTVFVFSGTYYGEDGTGEIRIKKSLKLLGENKETTIISGYNTLDFYIRYADKVLVSGFTITKGFVNIRDSSNITISGNLFPILYDTIYFTNSTYCTFKENIIMKPGWDDRRSCLEMWAGSSNNVIKDNIIEGRQEGIWLWHSPNTTVTNNYITNCYSKGILVSYYSRDCIISGNIITDCTSGMGFTGIETDAINTTIVGNTIQNLNATWADGMRITGYMTGNNTIVGNTIRNLTGGGSIGIWILDSSNNTVMGNTISNFNNDNHAIGISVRDSDNNVYARNKISGMNGYYGYGIEYDGLYYDGSKIVYLDTKIEGNIISDCSYSCIYLAESKSSSLIDNTLIGQFPNDNNIGICFGGFVQSTKIRNNTIKNHSIGMYQSIGCMGNLVSKNIFNNNGNAIILGRGGNPVGGASNNYVVANNFENSTAYCFYIEKGSKYNKIYHNNFINNGEHAYDQDYNTWDDGEEGNYWDDYEGVDVLPPYDIGDTPYYIEGKPVRSKDRYPLMDPVDIENFVMNFDMTEVESIQSQENFHCYPSNIPIIIAK